MNETVFNALPPVAAVAIRALRGTLRMRTHGRETVERFAREGQRYIHLFWHAHILLMVYSYVGPDILFLVSKSKDGELITRTVARFGYTMARGSSSEGGAQALREMMRAVRRGADIGFTPDGPRGPSRKVQPGCIVAARTLSIPLVPIAIGATRAWKLDSWDRFVVPKPFSRVLMAYGEPLTIERDEPIESGQERLERAMVALEDFAESNAGDPSVGVPL